MLIRQLLLIAAGASYGLLSAAGVFTVLVAVAGCFVTVFPKYSQWGSFLREQFPKEMKLWMATGVAAQAVFGLFSGMFIGCLALAIAEMLDSIPIFARRISFRHGLGWAILGMAAGKLCGSLLYFATEFYRTVQ